jgi:hypothetical protein
LGREAPVNRTAIVASFSIVIVASVFSQPAGAADLYVATTGNDDANDGSSDKPFLTIGRAVKQTNDPTWTADPMTIHVAPGSYHEAPPVTFLHANVTLLADNTGIPLDASGLPTGALPDGVVTVNPTVAIAIGTGLFVVRAANVRISGFVFDGTPPKGAGTGQLITVDGAGTVDGLTGTADGADGFLIDGNILKKASTGVFTRCATGTITRNYVVGNATGVHVCGWFPRDLKTDPILVQNNRVTQNTTVGCLVYGSPQQYMAPVLPLTTAQVTAGAGIAVKVASNDFVENGNDSAPLADSDVSSAYPGSMPSTGLYFLTTDATPTGTDPGQWTQIEACIEDNTFSQNFWYGTGVGSRIPQGLSGASLAPNGYNFDGEYHRNLYVGNGLNAAIFDFRHIQVSHGGGQQVFRFSRNSHYTITAPDDLLSSYPIASDAPARYFDYDNPTNNPDLLVDDAGLPLNNTLLVNGATVPNSIDDIVVTNAVVQQQQVIPSGPFFTKWNLNVGPYITMGTPGVGVNLGTAPDRPPVILSGGSDASAVAGDGFQAPVPDFTTGISAVDDATPNLTITQDPAAGTLVGIGTTVVTVTVTDGNLNTATVTRSFTVNPVPLTITVSDATKNFGDPNPSFTVSGAGFLGGDTVSSLLGTLTFSTDATATSGVGTYGVTVGGLSSPNYTITFVAGTLSVIYGSDFSGVLPPISADGSSIFKAGSTVPVKFTITVGGQPFAGATAKFSFSYRRRLNPTRSLASGGADATSLFRYDPISQLYIFNLSTKNWTPGSYVLHIALDDGTVHDVTIGVE